MIYNFSSVVGGGGLTQLRHFIDSNVFSKSDVLVINKNQNELFANIFCKKIVLSSWTLVKLFQLLFFRWLWNSKVKDQHKSYTLFGIGINTGCELNIVNVAMPILCYEESNFWKDLPIRKYVRTRLKRWARLLLLRYLANVITVESPVMKSRLSSFFRVPIFIMPPLGNKRVNLGKQLNLNRKRQFLYLTGNDSHKNIKLIYNLVNQYKQTLIDHNVEFVITGEGTSNEVITRIGTVQYDMLHEYINAAYALVNISDLESVSNNFIEAQIYGKPMLISREDFALWAVRTPYVSCNPRLVDELFQAVFKALEGSYIIPENTNSLTESIESRLKFLDEI